MTALSRIRWDDLSLKFALVFVFAFSIIAFVPNPASAATPITANVSFTVSGGGTGYGGPLFNYMSNGVPQTIQLSQLPISISIDLGSYWSLSAQLPGSNSTVSWGTRTTSGKASLSMPTSFVYYYQALVRFGYSVIGGGRPVVLANYTQYGIYQVDKQVGGSVWLDILSSYAYDQIVESTVAGERWITSGQTSGVVTGPVLNNAVYYHQYLITAEYGTWGGGNPPGVPSFSGISEGVPVSSSLTNYFSLLWLDAQTQYQATPAINVNAGERWGARGTTGMVTSPATLTFTYYHQFSLTANYNLVGGASPGQPLIQYSSAGTVVSSPLPTSPVQLWIDEGASYGLPLDLPGTSSTERWILVGAQWSNPINSPATTSPTYYHQYAYQIGYSSVGTGSFTTPTVSYTSLGVAYNSSLGQPTFWADSGAAVSVTQSEQGPEAGTLWRLGTQIPASAQGPFSATAVYYLQTKVQVSYQVIGGGNPPAPSFACTSLGHPTNNSLGTTESFWADIGSAWSAQSMIAGSSGERWVLQGGGLGGSVTSALTIGLNYQHQYQVQILVGKFGGGNVTNASGWFAPGHQVNLSATAEAGWIFGQWIGSENTTSDPTTINLDAPISETAVFYPGVAVNAGTGGQVRVVALPNSGMANPSNQFLTYVYPGSEVTIYATSSRLFQFTSWSGDEGGSQNPLTFTVRGPIAIDARFDVSVASYAFLVAAIAAVAVAGYFAYRFLRNRGVGLSRKTFDSLGRGQR